MTTYTHSSTSFLELAMSKLEQRALRKARKAREEATLSRFPAAIRVVLHLAGFALLTMGAFEFTMIAGYIMAGISCFAFSALVVRDSPPENRAPDLRTGR